MDFSNYAFDLIGEPYRLSAYKRGEVIDHVDAITIAEAEHMMVTRLRQNTAKVHFNVTSCADGNRLIYGEHVISLAWALSFYGQANGQMIVALKCGPHANPWFAGDTILA